MSVRRFFKTCKAHRQMSGDEWWVTRHFCRPSSALQKFWRTTWRVCYEGALLILYHIVQTNTTNLTSQSNNSKLFEWPRKFDLTVFCKILRRRLLLRRGWFTKIHQFVDQVVGYGKILLLQHQIVAISPLICSQWTICSWDERTEVAVDGLDLPWVRTDNRRLVCTIGKMRVEYDDVEHARFKRFALCDGGNYSAVLRCEQPRYVSQMKVAPRWKREKNIAPIWSPQWNAFMSSGFLLLPYLCVSSQITGGKVLQ